MLQNNSSRLIDMFLEIAKIDALSGNEKPVADFIKSHGLKMNYLQ